MNFPIYDNVLVTEMLLLQGYFVLSFGLGALSMSWRILMLVGLWYGGSSTSLLMKIERDGLVLLATSLPRR